MRCARGADISFHAKPFPDYFYESDIYDYSIHFQYVQEKKKRKKETYNIIINIG